MEYTRPRLALKTVEEVERLLSNGYTYSQINKLTGVSKASISKIKNGTYKKLDPEYKVEENQQYQKLYRTALKYKKGYEQKVIECEKLIDENNKLLERIKNLELQLEGCKSISNNSNLAYSNFFKR